eukprot:CAMPEP_0115577414 /NCGR_PEP_ID=MMETSP0272-20121206/3060_1 /TAXON_ID=71861 /ORGANISM="Scrippsiella trochoidea, Strain CCMP3099" /LENGTH=147 /DNA_ID=CAMNT_0003012225 /DNA_START=809 /DNA_END=1253 /DNA_ORIENTATION=-
MAASQETPVQVTHEVEPPLKSTGALQHELAIICSSTDVAMPEVPLAEQEAHILCGPAFPDLFAHPCAGPVVGANGHQQIPVGIVADLVLAAHALIQAAESSTVLVPIRVAIAGRLGDRESVATPMRALVLVWSATARRPLLAQIDDA